MAKYKKKVITITIPIDVDEALTNIVKDARKQNLICNKSGIILDALMLYFKTAQQITKKNEEKPEEQAN